jgi:hypothetical protein
VALFSSETKVGSNQLCGILIRVSTAKLTAVKWIRQSRSSQQHGRQAANSIGGSKNGNSGGAGCAAPTALNDGSELLIFVLRAVHSHDLSL